MVRLRPNTSQIEPIIKEKKAAPRDVREPIHPSSSSLTSKPRSPLRRFWDIWDVHPRTVPVDRAAKDAEIKIETG